jgi:mannose-6-phosphate isomerase-like protein (cupin superfamily)
MAVELDVSHAPYLLPPGGGEVVGDAPDRRVEILCDRDELHATWTRFGPGRDGALPHVHRRHNDLFYVLAGELTVGIGPDVEETTLQPGTLVLAPPLVVHAFRNRSDAELRYLNFHAPGAGFAGFLRGVRDGTGETFDSEDPPADGGLPAERALLTRSDGGGDSWLRATVLTDVDALGVAEAWGEPGSAAPPRHLHPRHLECFYVLAGELAFTIGDAELHAGVGSWVQVPPGTPHTFACTGSEEARYLNLHAPSCGYGAFVRALQEARDQRGLAEARALFDLELA